MILAADYEKWLDEQAIAQVRAEERKKVLREVGEYMEANVVERGVRWIVLPSGAIKTLLAGKMPGEE